MDGLCWNMLVTIFRKSVRRCAPAMNRIILRIDGLTIDVEVRAMSDSRGGLEMLIQTVLSAMLAMSVSGVNPPGPALVGRISDGGGTPVSGAIVTISNRKVREEHDNGWRRAVHTSASTVRAVPVTSGLPHRALQCLNARLSSTTVIPIEIGSMSPHWFRRINRRYRSLSLCAASRPQSFSRAITDRSQTGSKVSGEQVAQKCQPSTAGSQ